MGDKEWFLEGEESNIFMVSEMIERMRKMGEKVDIAFCNV